MKMDTDILKFSLCVLYTYCFGLNSWLEEYPAFNCYVGHFSMSCFRDFHRASRLVCGGFVVKIDGSVDFLDGSGSSLFP